MSEKKTFYKKILTKLCFQSYFEKTKKNIFDDITVVRTNKGRTNKGQITFFGKFTRD